MPSERRMFNRKIFQSSVCVVLADKNEGKELHAQRLWEILILNADDEGRGKLIPVALRADAYGTCPTAYNEITNDDIEKWVKEIVSTGAMVVYSNEVGERYYALTGWDVHQSGDWRRTPSIIMPPPPEYDLLFKSHPKTNIKYKKGICSTDARTLKPLCSTDALPDAIPKRKEENIKKENINSDKSKKTICRTSFSSDSKFYIAVKTLFPEITDEKAIQKQAAVLEAIERLDQMPLEELLPVLKWAQKDKEFWKSNFLSCARLRRKNDEVTMKWETMKAAYELAQNEESDSSSSESEPEEWICPDCGIKQKKFKSTLECIHCGGNNQND